MFRDYEHMRVSMEIAAEKMAKGFSMRKNEGNGSVVSYSSISKRPKTLTLRVENDGATLQIEEECSGEFARVTTGMRETWVIALLSSSAGEKAGKWLKQLKRAVAESAAGLEEP